MIIYYIKTIYESLKFNFFRTFLTGLGVLIGIASLVIIFTVSDSFSANILLDLNVTSEIKIGLVSSVTSGEKISDVIESTEVTQNITNIQNNIDGVSEFKQEDPRKMVSFYYNGNKKDGLEYEFDNDIYVDKGLSFNYEVGNVVILKTNSEFANNIELGEYIIINNVFYRVIGYTSQTIGNGNPTLYFPEYLRSKIMCGDYESTGVFKLRISTGYNSTEVVNKVLDTLNEKLSNDLKFINYTEETKNSLKGVIQSISVFIALISGISLVVAGINVANIMYISTLERRNEVAIFRAMGMKKSQVTLLFLIEAVMIVLVFSFLGYIIGLFSAYVIVNIIGIKLIVNYYTICIVIILSIIIGIISGYRPAKVASNINTADILN